MIIIKKTDIIIIIQGFLYGVVMMIAIFLYYYSMNEMNPKNLILKIKRKKNIIKA